MNKNQQANPEEKPLVNANVKKRLNQLVIKGQRHLRAWSIARRSRYILSHAINVLMAMSGFVLTLSLLSLVQGFGGWYLSLTQSVLLIFIPVLLYFMGMVFVTLALAKPSRERALFLYDNFLSAKDRLVAADEFINYNSQTSFQKAAIIDAVKYIDRAELVNLPKTKLVMAGNGPKLRGKLIVSMLLLFFALWLPQDQINTQIDMDSIEASSLIEDIVNSDTTLQETLPKNLAVETQTQPIIESNPTRSADDIVGLRPKTERGEQSTPGNNMAGSNQRPVMSSESESSSGSKGNSSSGGQQPATKTKIQQDDSADSQDIENLQAQTDVAESKAKESVEAKESQTPNQQGNSANGSEQHSKQSSDDGIESSANNPAQLQASANMSSEALSENNAFNQSESKTASSPHSSSDNKNQTAASANSEQSRDQSSESNEEQQSQGQSKDSNNSAQGQNPEGNRSSESQQQKGKGSDPIKKSRGVASLMLGTPLLDHLKGAENEGFIKKNQEISDPTTEISSSQDAEGRKARNSLIKPIAHPIMSTQMKLLVRDYFETISEKSEQETKEE